MDDFDARMFEADMDLFFDTLLKKMEEGKISSERVETFFPEDVVARASEEKPAEND